MKKSRLITIIIIVKNDKRIEFTLKKIVPQISKKNIEVIVIDASEGTIDDIKKKFPEVKWIHYHRTFVKRTYSEQRNLGIQKAKGNIVVFIDADCTPTKYWLEKLTTPIITGEELVVVGSVASVNKRSIWDVEQERMSISTYVNECSTINMAFSKKIIENTGYFDESFEAGEDMDFSWRLIDKGYKIRYIKEALIYTDWGDFKHQIKRALIYGQARIRLYRKHPAHAKQLFSTDPALMYSAFIIFLPLTIFCPFYPLLLLLPLLKNIKKNPIRTVFFNLVFGIGVIISIIKSNIKYKPVVSGKNA